MKVEQRPPRVGRKVLIRSALAGFIIVLLTGGAMAATVLLEVDDVKDSFLGSVTNQIEIPEITRAEAGQPRTVLILGADQRWENKVAGERGRSDTIMLARVDPDKDAIAMMSIPRDLKVAIPGIRYPDRINVAYANGGPSLTVRTIQQVFESVTGEPFPIHNVIIGNFSGFRRAVNYIDGVYVDIDHKYFNDNSGRDQYATIDVNAGYQKLKGQDALDYVRFRHTDNDFLRGARQQDFVRQVKAQDGAKKLLDLGRRDELAKVFGRYFQLDKSLRSTKNIVSMLKLAMFSRDKAVREVRFRISESGNYVLAGPEQLKTTWDEFMHAKGSKTPRHQQSKTKADKEFAKKRKKKKNKLSKVAGLEVAKREGEDQAIVAGRHSKFPFYFPTLRTVNAAYAGKEPRVYKITDQKGNKHDAYRLVVSRGTIGEYYGIQGMTWKNPPILENPSETRTVNGRKLMLFYDGRHLRIVAWKTDQGVYWVSNTLTLSVTNPQMLAIATSLRRLGQK